MQTEDLCMLMSLDHTTVECGVCRLTVTLPAHVDIMCRSQDERMTSSKHRIIKHGEKVVMASRCKKSAQICHRWPIHLKTLDFCQLEYSEARILLSMG